MAHRFFTDHSNPASDEHQDDTLLADTSSAETSENLNDTGYAAHNNEQQSTPAPAVSQEDAPPVPAAKPSRASAGTKGKRGRPAKTAEDDTKKQLSFWTSIRERNELKVACIYAGTSVNDFSRNAVMDALHHTYECTSPDCGFQFTARITDGREPPKATTCPFCGQKISLIRY